MYVYIVHAVYGVMRNAGMTDLEPCGFAFVRSNDVRQLVFPQECLQGDRAEHVGRPPGKVLDEALVLFEVLFYGRVNLLVPRQVESVC